MRRHDPALSLGVILAGCVTSFYVFGFLLIALGLWLWTRTEQEARCPACSAGAADATRRRALSH